MDAVTNKSYFSNIVCAIKTIVNINIFFYCRKENLCTACYFQSNHLSVKYHHWIPKKVFSTTKHRNTQSTAWKHHRVWNLSWTQITRLKVWEIFWKRFMLKFTSSMQWGTLYVPLENPLPVNCLKINWTLSLNNHLYMLLGFLDKVFIGLVKFT